MVSCAASMLPSGLYCSSKYSIFGLISLLLPTYPSCVSSYWSYTFFCQTFPSYWGSRIHKFMIQLVFMIQVFLIILKYIIYDLKVNYNFCHLVGILLVQAKHFSFVDFSSSELEWWDGCSSIFQCLQNLSMATSASQWFSTSCFVW